MHFPRPIEPSAITLAMVSATRWASHTPVLVTSSAICEHDLVGMGVLHLPVCLGHATNDKTHDGVVCLVSVYLSVYVSVYLSVYLSVYVSVPLCLCGCVCLCVCLCVCV